MDNKDNVVILDSKTGSMFNFYVFHPGGLLLWSSGSKENVDLIKHYIHTIILEGKNVGNEISVDKMTCLVIRSSSHNIYFSVTLHSLIAEKITYLTDLLTDLSNEFVEAYESILSNKNLIYTPSNFESFSADKIVDKYRNVTHIKPRSYHYSQNNTEEQPGKKSKSGNKGKGGKQSGGKDLLYKKKDEVDESLSTVIKSNNETQEVTVEKYDLDNFEGVVNSSSSKSSFFNSLFKGIVGEKVLDEDLLTPIINDLETHLIDKNVAAPIAKKLTTSVMEKLEGTTVSNFSNVKQIVQDSLRENVELILTPNKNIDVIRDIQVAKEQKRPYVLAFVGVNGVGKSTSLAKLAYLFKSLDFKVLITACDTFRSGAIDQLSEHSKKLSIELYQRGGSKRDPVPVARDSLTYAKENGFDVVLIDTAGRMQNDHDLMNQIARLINEVRPDLTLFLAEALVGNNGSDQIRSFDSILKRYNLSNGSNLEPKGIDGIMLTKFDTIDDKVGAALTLVYETGHPILFLGVGQTYRDLRRMNPEFVVNTLLSTTG